MVIQIKEGVKLTKDDTAKEEYQPGPGCSPNGGIKDIPSRKGRVTDTPLPHFKRHS